MSFADHWRNVTGHDPKLLIMDSNVITQPELAKLLARGITFITLRARTPKLTAATLSKYPGTLRQIAVAGLGHDEPTILITNDLNSPAKNIIERYARRMNIEQRLAGSIRSFGPGALAGAVPLNVDLDVVLTVLAHTVCAAMRRRLPGYATPNSPPFPGGATDDSVTNSPETRVKLAT